MLTKCLDELRLAILIAFLLFSKAKISHFFRLILIVIAIQPLPEQRSITVAFELLLSFKIQSTKPSVSTLGIRTLSLT